MTDHFQLDVDVDSLRLAQQKLTTLAEAVAVAGPKLSAAPDDIAASWTGPASTKIKAEMRALGANVGGFSPKFGDAAAAVKTFADAVAAFQEGPLVQHNLQWESANQDAAADIAQAKTDFADDEEKLGTKRGEIAGGLRYTLQAISHSYAQERQALADQAKALGDTLGTLTTVAVPDSVATRFVSRGGSGTVIGWCDEQGSFPPDLNADAALAGLTLAEDADQLAAGVRAAQQVDPSLTPTQAEELLASLNGESEAFRQAFIENLDPAALRQFQFLANSTHDETDREAYGELITAIAALLATGSNSQNQSTYAVGDSTYDDLIEAYTGGDNDHDVEQGHLMLAELVAAGQGEDATWDSDLLSGMAGDALAYERERLADDPTFNWTSAAHHLTFPTKTAQEWFGHAPGQGDPILLYLDALGEDPDAAQDTMRVGSGQADTDLLHYLYERTSSGNWHLYNTALGESLTAATSLVGPGGEGSREYASAEIVSDLVSYWAENPDRYSDSLSQSITDILTNHVQAVNHAGMPFESAVIEGRDNATLTHQQIALANLSSEDLEKVLGLAFGMDYWANHVAQEKDPDSHSFPGYTQLALAMELAARDDVMLAAQSGEQGLLEQTVNRLSENQERVSNAFTAAMEGEGATRDQANADARAGLTFVLGLVKDSVDTGSGTQSALAGAGLEGLQALLTDAIIPESAYTEDALSQADHEAYRRQLTSLKLVQWLDQAGALPPEHSPTQWAAENPEHASFLADDGTMLPLDQLYHHREENPEQWDDFVRYYMSDGGPWLAEIDLDEQFTLGWLEADAE